MAINLNDNIKVSAPKATDYKYGPWNSIADAQSNVVSAFRYQGMTQAIVVSGATVEHWYRDGIADVNLIPKSVSTSEANLTYLDPVELAFSSSADSLPSATSTQIDGVTVEDAWRVLVLESNDSAETSKIYTSSVSGSAITWNVVSGEGASAGSEGDTTYVLQGDTFINQRYTYNDSAWTTPSYTPVSGIPDWTLPVDRMQTMVGNTDFGDAMWIPNMLYSVEEYFATNSAAVSDGLFDQPAGNGRSAYIADTEQAVWNVGVPNLPAVQPLSSNRTDAAIFCKNRMSIFFYDSAASAVAETPLFKGDAIFDTIQFTGGTGDQGTVGWNSDEEMLYVILNGTTAYLPQDGVWNVRNDSGGDLPKGTPVMATGTVGASGRIKVNKMDGTDKNNARLYLGLLDEDLTNGSDGKAIRVGKVRGITTDGSDYSESWADGDIIYISNTTAGELTNLEPTSGLKMAVSFVINAHASNGTLAVRSNNINENMEFVDLIDAPSAYTGKASTPVAVNSAATGLEFTSELYAFRPVQNVSGSAKTLALTDANQELVLNGASACTITIPANSSVAFPIGAEFDIYQLSAFVPTIQAASGVTLNGSAAGSITITTQYTGASLKKIATDTWRIVGTIG